MLDGAGLQGLLLLSQDALHEVDVHGLEGRQVQSDVHGEETSNVGHTKTGGVLLVDLLLASVLGGK